MAHLDEIRGLAEYHATRISSSPRDWMNYLDTAEKETVRIRGFRNTRHLWNMAEVRLSAKEKKSLCWEWEV